MAKNTDIEHKRKAELQTLIGKLGYLRKVCPRARLTLDILVGLIKEGEALWVEKLDKFTFVNFESGNLIINPQGGVLFTINIPK